MMYLRNKPDKPRELKYKPMTEKEKSNEELRDKRFLDLGINTYEFSFDHTEMTDEEQAAINEAYLLIMEGKEIPVELEKRVKQITSKNSVTVQST